MRLKRDLSFAREGYDLLEQKRQILVVELMDLVDKTVDAQEKAEKELVRAYEALNKAVLASGRSTLTHLAAAVNIESDITLRFRRVMGVNLPQVEVKVTDVAPYFSPGDTTFWADETIARFKGLLQELGTLAERRISLMRIAEEVRKTVRRVNALQKIAIPDLNESIKYIEDTLEESEREMFATLKLVKTALVKKRG